MPHGQWCDALEWDEIAVSLLGTLCDEPSSLGAVEHEPALTLCVTPSPAAQDTADAPPTTLAAQWSIADVGPTLYLTPRLHDFFENDLVFDTVDVTPLTPYRSAEASMLNYIPEPGTLLLLAAGVLMLFGPRRKRATPRE